MCRLEGDGLLHCSLEALNEAVLADAEAAAHRDGSASGLPASPPESPVSPLLPHLADLLETAGISSPLEKVSSPCIQSQPYGAQHALHDTPGGVLALVLQTDVVDW